MVYSEKKSNLWYQGGSHAENNPTHGILKEALNFESAFYPTQDVKFNNIFVTADRQI